jgi:predicted small metal-binding protein
MFCTKYIRRYGFIHGSGGEEMPSFKCKDIGMSCPFEASALTESGLMKKISKHAAEAHNMKEVDPETMKKIKAAIK